MRISNMSDSLRVPQINKRSSLPTYLNSPPSQEIVPLQKSSSDDRISFFQIFFCIFPSFFTRYPMIVYYCVVLGEDWEHGKKRPL